MYLSKKQMAALDLALEAIDGFRSGEKTDEEQEAFDTIIQMLDASRRENLVGPVGNLGSEKIKSCMRWP